MNTDHENLQKGEIPQAPGDKWLHEARRNEDLEKERDWLRSMNDLLEQSANSLDSLPECISVGDSMIL